MAASYDESERVTKTPETTMSVELPTNWFQRDAQIVAAELIGCEMIVRDGPAPEIRIRIVETEAYLSSNDLACHAAHGRTARNAPMFQDGGLLYVYSIYGLHHCVNVVTEKAGQGSAVLLRGAEVLEGENSLRQRRGDVETSALLRGPGNLCKALGFSKQDNLRSCSSASLFLIAPSSAPNVHVSTRIGIRQDADLALRFYDPTSSSVSSHKRGRPLELVSADAMTSKLKS